MSSFEHKFGHYPEKFNQSQEINYIIYSYQANLLFYVSLLEQDIAKNRQGYKVYENAINTIIIWFYPNYLQSNIILANSDRARRKTPSPIIKGYQKLMVANQEEKSLVLQLKTIDKSQTKW